MSLLPFRWSLVDDQVNELKRDEANSGLVSHRQRQNQLVEWGLVALVGLIRRCFRDQIESVRSFCQPLDDLTEAFAGEATEAWHCMVHELVQSGEEVKFAFDVLPRGLEFEKARHNFKDLLDDFSLGVPQAVLELIYALVLDEDIHEPIMIRLECLAHPYHTLHSCVILLSCGAVHFFKVIDHVLDQLKGGNYGQASALLAYECLYLADWKVFVTDAETKIVNVIHGNTKLAAKLGNQLD